MANKTIRAAQAQARELGMVIRAAGGGPVAHEFEVRHAGQRGDAASYFTDDLADALAMAETMAQLGVTRRRDAQFHEARLRRERLAEVERAEQDLRARADAGDPTAIAAFEA